MRAFQIPADSAYSYRDGSQIDQSFGYHPHSSTRFKNMHPIESGIRRSFPELYFHREECCGCTACAYICPKRAISMEPDEEGFDYPVVDASLCICCYRCLDICAFKKGR